MLAFGFFFFFSAGGAVGADSGSGAGAEAGVGAASDVAVPPVLVGGARAPRVGGFRFAPLGRPIVMKSSSFGGGAGSLDAAAAGGGPPAPIKAARPAGPLFLLLGGGLPGKSSSLSEKPSLSPPPNIAFDLAAMLAITLFLAGGGGAAAGSGSAAGSAAGSATEVSDAAASARSEAVGVGVVDLEPPLDFDFFAPFFLSSRLKTWSSPPAEKIVHATSIAAENSSTAGA